MEKGTEVLPEGFRIFKNAAGVKIGAHLEIQGIGGAHGSVAAQGANGGGDQRRSSEPSCHQSPACTLALMLSKSVSGLISMPVSLATVFILLPRSKCARRASLDGDAAIRHQLCSVSPSTVGGSGAAAFERGALRKDNIEGRQHGSQFLHLHGRSGQLHVEHCVVILI